MNVRIIRKIDENLIRELDEEIKRRLPSAITKKGPYLEADGHIEGKEEPEDKVEKE